MGFAVLSPLNASGVYKSYGTTNVLEDISLSLIQGEIFGLVGVNGAGKTTFLKILLDLAKADSGDISIFGVSSEDPKSRRALSYLPEKFQPSRYLKGIEYLSLALSYYGRRLLRDRARAMAEGLSLEPSKLGYKVGAYSKGMGQKLGLIGAFLADVPLLILDEPMSGLDPLARIRLKEEMLSQKKAGKTIFFSSHILSDIDEICDRIGVIHDGKLLFVGTPALFKQAHASAVLEQAFLRAVSAVADG